MADEMVQPGWFSLPDLKLKELPSLLAREALGKDLSAF